MPIRDIRGHQLDWRFDNSATQTGAFEPQSSRNTEARRNPENEFTRSLCQCGEFRLPAVAAQPRWRLRGEIGLRNMASINSTLLPARSLLSVAERRNRGADLGMAHTRISPGKMGGPLSCRCLATRR